MNLERGFRRIVLTISLTAAGAGLVVTVYDTYKTAQYVSANKKYAPCITEADQLPTDDVIQKIMKDNPGVSRENAILAYIAARERLCPEYPEYPMTLWYKVPLDAESYMLALLPLLWGVLVIAGLGAIPWGLFYLVRWFVQGFKE